MIASIINAAIEYSLSEKANDRSTSSGVLRVEKSESRVDLVKP